MITLAGCVAAPTAGCRPVVPSSWEEGLGVVEKNTVITYFYIFIGQALFVPLPPRTPPSRRRGPRWVSTTLARDSPPFTGGVGGWVFRRCSRPAAGSTSQSSARAEERS